MNTTQKIIKAFAIVTAVSIIASLVNAVVYIFGATVSSTNELAEESRLFEKSYPAYNELKIDLKSAKITIKDGSEYIVEGKNLPKALLINHEDGTLEIRDSSRYNAFFSQVPEITIYIPGGALLNKLDVKSGTNDLQIININSLEAKISNGSGRLELQNVHFNDVEIEGGVGEITAYQSALNNLELDSGIGRVKIEAHIQGTSKIESGIGEVELNLLGGIEKYNIITENGIGIVSIDNPDNRLLNGSNIINVKSGIGSIVVSFPEFQEGFS